MDVVSTCPLTVGSVLWQPRPNKWAFTFVCKATYELAPTESALATEQEAPYEDDNHWNDDPTRSLYAAADLVPFKARCDVTLVGHAFAPRREPVRSLVAQLIVGSMTKAIDCSCDRMWTLDGQLREGPRLVKFPLRYERAAGGPDTSNPVGMRPDVADAYGVAHVPNLMPAGESVPKRGDAVKPIGFGPVASTWPTRIERLGRYATTWPRTPWNSVPVPEDLDPGYFNCAPFDQQVGAIRPGERLVLENLHPEHPRLVTSLARTVPIAMVERPGVAPEEVRLKCDTLWIDTDRSLCTLVWRGRVALDNPQQAGRVVVSLEGRAAAAPRPGAKPAWQDLAPQATTQAMKVPKLGGHAAGAGPGARSAAGAGANKDHHEEEDETFVASLDDADEAGVLPFVKPGAPGAGGLPFVAPDPARASSPSYPKLGDDPPHDEKDDTVAWQDTTAVQAGMRAAVSALPFQRRGTNPAPPAPAMDATSSSLPFQARPSQPSMPAIDPSQVPSISPMQGSPAPPPMTPMQGSPAPPPMTPMQGSPAPPPLVRPPPTLDPIAPAAASTPSPWAVSARGGPGLGGPGLGSPAMGSPGMVSPGMVSPNLGSPNLGSPGIGSPGIGSPGMGSPGIGSPGMGSPGMGQPNVGDPTSTLQGGIFLVKPEPPAAQPLSPAAAAAAATAGAAAASNAAARGARVGTSPTTPTTGAAAQPSRPGAREILTLLWFDPACVKLLPENKRWAEILAQPDEDPEDSDKDDKKNGAGKGKGKDDDGDDGNDEGLVADDDDEYGDFEEPEPPPPPDVPAEVRDRRQVFKIVARAEPSAASGIHQAVADAINKDGTLEPPLTLVAGDLVFPFDELETLKATVTAVSPLVANDKKLKEVVDTVNELLKTPWLSRSSSVAEGLTGRIKEAFGQGNRMLPPSYLESHTERILLEERHYQKRTVFGQTWIRSLFMPAGTQEPIPAYLPESLTKQLPMFQRLKTRLLAEVHMQQDQYEAQPIALRVVALARVSALSPPPPGGSK